MSVSVAAKAEAAFNTNKLAINKRMARSMEFRARQCTD
jgi:hypothetical protein